MPIDLADKIVKEHWTDPNSDVGVLRQKVWNACEEILNEKNVAWDDLQKSRTQEAIKARQHVCGFIYLVLRDRMSEVEMAKWVGMGRTTFRYNRVSFFEKHREQIPA